MDPPRQPAPPAPRGTSAAGPHDYRLGPAYRSPSRFGKVYHAVRIRKRQIIFFVGQFCTSTPPPGSSAANPARPRAAGFGSREVLGRQVTAIPDVSRLRAVLRALAMVDVERVSASVPPDSFLAVIHPEESGALRRPLGPPGCRRAPHPVTPPSTEPSPRPPTGTKQKGC